MFRRIVRMFTIGVMGSTALAAAAYWLTRYLRPRHSPLELDGAVVVIAEATTALGRAYAQALAQSGARLALASNDVEALNALRLTVDPYAADVLTIAADFTTEAGRAAIVAETLNHYGLIGLLIVEMGTLPGGPLDTLNESTMLTALNSRLLSILALTRQTLPILLKRDSGVIVFVTPVAGRVATPGLSLYATAAQGLFGFAASLRHELVGTRITLSPVITGWIYDQSTPTALQRWLARVRLPLVEPEAVAAATINGIFNRQDEIVVGGSVYRVLAWLDRHVPTLTGLYWRTFNSPDWLAATRDMNGPSLPVIKL